MNRVLLRVGLFTIFLVFCIGLNACRKKIKLTAATVSVIDTVNHIVEYAMVRLYSDLHAIDDTLFTDFEGKAVFDYTSIFDCDDEGCIELDIEVVLSNTVNGEDSLKGEGTIKVGPKMVNEEDVAVFPA